MFLSTLFLVSLATCVICEGGEIDKEAVGELEKIVCCSRMEPKEIPLHHLW
uniref:Isoform 2 of Carboxylesterase 1F n=1 Tax=Mus musculus TaxID=10090 RepID=Q91WU0-2